MATPPLEPNLKHDICVASCVANKCAVPMCDQAAEPAVAMPHYWCDMKQLHEICCIVTDQLTPWSCGDAVFQGVEIEKAMWSRGSHVGERCLKPLWKKVALNLSPETTEARWKDGSPLSQATLDSPSDRNRHSDEDLNETTFQYSATEWRKLLEVLSNLRSKIEQLKQSGRLQRQVAKQSMDKAFRNEQKSQQEAEALRKVVKNLQERLSEEKEMKEERQRLLQERQQLEQATKLSAEQERCKAGSMQRPKSKFKSKFKMGSSS